ncbi:MAG TPA: GNAT family N-acetyltransferase [Actinospica sp.]|jgi:GNAT superfamily N-acetyltransferase|nr:GNAT family N-acetyltransferase [Actinospica sp.]
MPAPPIASVRGALPEDLPALARIAELALTWDPDAAALVELLWPPATAEAGFAVLAEVDGAAVGFALGSLGPAPADPAVKRHGHVNILAVAAEARRRGVGSALLAELEQRLFAAGAWAVMIGGATPIFAWPGVDVRYTAAACLVRARGYEATTHAVNMTVELEAAEANGRLATAVDEQRLRAAGVTVRRLTESDRALIAPWLTAWGGTWGREVLSTLGNPAAGTYIAVLHEGAGNAEYVGFASHGVNRAGWFGPMGTGGPLRKLGIGGVLLRRALADMRAAGHATAQICWVGPVAFYARTVDGYVERVFWLYRKEL